MSYDWRESDRKVLLQVDFHAFEVSDESSQQAEAPTQEDEAQIPEPPLITKLPLPSPNEAGTRADKVVDGPEANGLIPVGDDSPSSSSVILREGGPLSASDEEEDARLLPEGTSATVKGKMFNLALPVSSSG